MVIIKNSSKLALALLLSAPSLCAMDKSPFEKDGYSAGPAFKAAANNKPAELLEMIQKHGKEVKLEPEGSLLEQIVTHIIPLPRRRDDNRSELYRQCLTALLQKKCITPEHIKLATQQPVFLFLQRGPEEQMAKIMVEHIAHKEAVKKRCDKIVAEFEQSKNNN